MTIGLLFLLTPGVVMAQGIGPGGTTASNIPILASGVEGAVQPGEEAMPPNAFQAGLVITGAYDDNVFPTMTPRQWNVNYSILPDVSFQETRPRLEWSADYSPGIEISQRAFYRNLFSQRFKGNFIWLVSPHGTLSVQQYYLVTTAPFGNVNGIEPGPTISPNETIYLPNVRDTWSLSHLLYSYQASEQTTMGIGGLYQLQNFDSIPQSGATTPLIHSQVASGQAYISHQFSARNQLGFQYGAEVLKFTQENARTTTHSFTVFDQVNFSDHSILTLYGGPEYSLIADQVVLNLGFIAISIPVNENQWSGAGGVLYQWTGERFAALIDVSRQVSDGGVVFGAVELTSGKAEFSWQLSHNWTVDSTLRGADDQLLASTSPGNELRTYSGQIGLRRQLGRDFAFDWFYERLNETGSINGLSFGNHDIFGVSLQYKFLRPLGR